MSKESIYIFFKTEEFMRGVENPQPQFRIKSTYEKAALVTRIKAGGVYCREWLNGKLVVATGPNKGEHAIETITEAVFIRLPWLETDDVEEE